MELFYKGPDVTVDRDFARFGSKSYAIDKITSTDVKTTHPYSGCGIGLMLVALFCLFLAIGGFKAGIFIALAGGVAAIWLMMRQSFSLVIVTSASEVNAYQSTDKDLISTVKEAVETAMISTKTK
jgi:hypothetical protein